MKQVAIVIALYIAGAAVAQESLSITRQEKSVVQKVAEPLLLEIYRRAGINITITPRPAMRANMETVNGVFDGEAARVFSYGERNPSLIRVEPAYYYVNSTVFARADTVVAINSKEDLKKYRVGIVRGTQHAVEATADLEHVETAPDSLSLFQMLEAGRFDVALDSEINGIYAIKKLGYKNIGKRTVLSRQELFHYLHAKNKAKVPVLSAAIQNLVKSGEMLKMGRASEKAFIESGQEP